MLTRSVSAKGPRLDAPYTEKAQEGPAISSRASGRRDGDLTCRSPNLARVWPPHPPPRRWKRGGLRLPQADHLARLSLQGGLCSAGRTVSGLFDGIVGQVSVLRRRLHIPVSQQLANQLKRHAPSGGRAGIAMAKIVQTHIVKSGFCPDPPPHSRRADIGLCGIAFGREHEGRPVCPADRLQAFERGRTHLDDFGAGLGVAQEEAGSAEVDL